MSVRAVVRGAISEVPQYDRCTAVITQVPAHMAMRGYVRRDVSHVVAELLDNSLAYSAPWTRVVVTRQPVPAGLAIEVVDRAIGMTQQVRERMNRLLAHPDEVDTSEQVRSGRIGLPTTAKIAQRRDITVGLAANALGGTTALVVVPAKHLLRLADTPAPASAPPAPTSAVPQPGTPQQDVRLLEGVAAPGAGRPDDGEPEAREDAVLGDDDTRGQELREGHGGRVVGIAPVLLRDLSVNPQDMPGPWGEVVADLQIDHSKVGQHLLIEHTEHLTLRHLEVDGHLRKVLIDLARDVRSDVRGGAAGRS
ncbi:ATP-binding protein [Streptomyces bauhiniae]|uniref:ATP-binding protein n=1 Tax=Streptomyces bauhiniae TaxID=2340725 RepID=UPI00381F24D3